MRRHSVIVALSTLAVLASTPALARRAESESVDPFFVNLILWAGIVVCIGGGALLLLWSAGLAVRPSTRGEAAMPFWSGVYSLGAGGSWLVLWLIFVGF